jgi:serine/threonine protein kinase
MAAHECKQKIDSRKVGPYSLGKVVSKGQYWKVKIAIHEQTLERVLVKVFDLKNLEKETIDKVKAEASLLRILRHRFVAQLIDVIQNPTRIYFIFRYFEGKLLSSENDFTPDRARNIFRAIIEVVSAMHSLSFCHHGIRLENIYSSDNGGVMFMDFTSSKLLYPHDMFEIHNEISPYSAPETLVNPKYTGKPVDIWSMGVLLYRMVENRFPFDDPNANTLSEMICHGKYELSPSLPPSLQDLFSKMLTLDPSQRITIEEILTHEWCVHEEHWKATESPQIKLTSPITDDPFQRIAFETLVNLNTIFTQQQITQKLLSDEPELFKAFYRLAKASSPSAPATLILTPTSTSTSHSVPKQRMKVISVSVGGDIDTFSLPDLPNRDGDPLEKVPPVIGATSRTSKPRPQFLALDAASRYKSTTDMLSGARSAGSLNITFIIREFEQFKSETR